LSDLFFAVACARLPRLLPCRHKQEKESGRSKEGKELLNEGRDQILSAFFSNSSREGVMRKTSFYPLPRVEEKADKPMYL